MMENKFIELQNHVKECYQKEGKLNSFFTLK